MAHVPDVGCTPKIRMTPMAELRLIEAICEALHEEMARDRRVVMLGQDVGVKGGVFGASKGLLEAFGPMRVLDTPVSEIVIAGAAIGAAMMGLRPVAEFQFADYMHPAYDQIVNQAATIRWRSVGGLRRARRVPGAVRRRRERRGVPLAEHGGVLLPRARAQGGRARDAALTPRACSSPRSATTTPWCSSSRRAVPHGA